MAKGFKMPSFSMPKPNINLGNVKMPDVNFESLAKSAGIPEASNLQSAMNAAGVKMPTLDDIRGQAASKFESVKNIKPEDVKNFAKEKLEAAKNIKPEDIVDAAKTKYEEAKSTVNDLKEMKQTLEDSGVSFNFKGGK